jgi:hypothetical protein
MDRTSKAHAGIPVFTTDASGIAGGGPALLHEAGDQRFFMKFLEGECAPDRSSNWREFRAGLEGLKKFAESFGY